MAPVIYVIRVLGHPEYKVESIVSESLERATKAYMAMREVPVELIPKLFIYDCYAAIEYEVTNV